MYKDKITVEDLVGAIVVSNGDTVLIESVEDAETLLESYRRASIAYYLDEDDEEYQEAAALLGDTGVIMKWIDGCVYYALLEESIW